MMPVNKKWIPDMTPGETMSGADAVAFLQRHARRLADAMAATPEFIAAVREVDPDQGAQLVLDHLSGLALMADTIANGLRAQAVKLAPPNPEMTPMCTGAPLPEPTPDPPPSTVPDPYDKGLPEPHVPGMVFWRTLDPAGRSIVPVLEVMVDGSEAHRRGIQQLVPAGDGTGNLIARPARSVEVRLYEQLWHPAAVPQ